MKQLQCQNRELLGARERKVGHSDASAGRQLAAKSFPLSDFDLTSGIFSSFHHRRFGPNYLQLSP